MAACQVRGTAPAVAAPRHDRVPAVHARRVTVVTAVGVTAVAHASIVDPAGGGITDSAMSAGIAAIALSKAGDMEITSQIAWK